MPVQSRQIPPELEQQMREIGEIVGDKFRAMGCCFALFTFDIGEGGWSNYISNAERGDMIKALRELCDNMERDGAPEH